MTPEATCLPRFYWMWPRKHARHVPGAPALELRGVSAEYNGRPALLDVTFRLDPGDRLAVVGPNGAGKTTLLRVLAGLVAPTSGEVWVYGYRPRGHICIAYLPQRAELDWSFPVTVADVVMMGRIGKLGLFRRPRPRDWALVQEMLAVVGMEKEASRQIGELSGGQKQRMFIARALAQEAQFMLLDEPLAGLDASAQEEILALVTELPNRGITLVFTLHELDIAAVHFPKALLLNRRVIGFGRPEEVFTPERLQEAYGSHLRVVHAADGLIAISDTCCQGKHGID